MQTIDDYLDAARDRTGLPSDRQLALKMRIEPASLNAWRTKRSWPADHQMVNLAELAELDPDLGLVELNIWRTKSPAAREHYSAIRRLITAAGLVAGFITAMLPALLGAAGGTKAAQIDMTLEPRDIMENLGDPASGGTITEFRHAVFHCVREARLYLSWRGLLPDGMAERVRRDGAARRVSGRYGRPAVGRLDRRANRRGPRLCRR